MFDIYIKGTTFGSIPSLIPTKGYAISQDGTKVLVAIKGSWMDPKQNCDSFQWWPLENTVPFLHND